LNSLLRKAIAPVLTADEMFIMLSVPLCCLPTQTANPAATPIDATEAPMGSMSSKTICGLFPLDSLYKGLRATKQQLEQGRLTRHISITKSVFETMYCKSDYGIPFLSIENLQNMIAHGFNELVLTFKGRIRSAGSSNVYIFSSFIDAHLRPGDILADQIPEMDRKLSWIKENDCLYNQDRTSHVCLLVPEGC
jgi:hypothetical protein